MKKLLLIRHAKATHHDKNDFERPLTPSGMQDAILMARRMHAQHIQPQIIISSPALRALTTANIFAEHLSLPEPQTDKLIYEAKRGDLLKVINGFPDEYEFIAMAGHNPDISQTVQELTNEFKEVPPCAIALMAFDVDKWVEIFNSTGTLLEYSTPGE